MKTVLRLNQFTGMSSLGDVRPGRGPLTSTRTDVTWTPDTDGVYRQVSALKPAPYGAREISTDVWSKYDVAGSLLGTTEGIVCSPQRENLALYSQQFDNVAWLPGQAGGGPVTVTADQIASPDGTVNADILAGNGAQFPRITQSITVATSTKYTQSVFVKAKTGTVFTLRFYTGSEKYRTVFNPTNGSLVSESGTGLYNVTNEGNGWYKYQVTATTSSTPFEFYIVPGLYDGSGRSEEIYIWQGQLEAGNAATLPIVTTGAPDTRTPDTHTLDISNYNDEMTVTGTITFHSANTDQPISQSDKGVIVPTATSAAHLVGYGTDGAGDGYLEVKDSSANVAQVGLNWVKDTQYNFCVSISKIRAASGIAVAGVDSGDGTFAGFTLADVITLGLSANEEFTIDNLVFKPGVWSNPAARVGLAP